MKTVLCFGDSLTWGYIPGTHGRYPFEQRWTGVLQKELGSSYRVIEEGLNGRTTMFDDPFTPHRNGSHALPMLLETHAPIDLLILLLGTNDLKTYRRNTAREAAMGCGGLITLALKSVSGPGGKAPQVLLLSPPPIAHPKEWMETLFEGSEPNSHSFSTHYRRAAERYQVYFLDIAPLVKPSKSDGIHLEVSENRHLGEKIAEKVKEIL